MTACNHAVDRLLILTGLINAALKLEPKTMITHIITMMVRHNNHQLMMLFILASTCQSVIKTSVKISMELISLLSVSHPALTF